MAHRRYTSLQFKITNFIDILVSKMKSFQIILLIVILSLGNFSTVIAQSENTEKNSFIIMFDESHNQYFDSNMMDTALNSLNDAFGDNVNIELIIQKNQFNSTNIQGVDLVIITNPGKDANSELPEISSSETDALENLMNIGGSVFYMSNPLSHNPNITGHASPMNDLLFDKFGVSIDTSNDGDNTTVIIDEFNYRNNNSFITLNSKNVKDQTIVSELHNITIQNGAEFLYYGTHIKETSGLEGSISGNTSLTAYNLDKSFNIDLFQPSSGDTPRWMYGKEYDSDGGRGILIGSSIMFSDYAFDNGSSWVEQGANLKLFQNIVAWLLNITPLNEDSSILDESFGSYFLGFNILNAIILGVGLFAIFALLFSYQNKLKLNSLLQFSKMKNETGPKKQKSKNKISNVTKSSKTARRKRT